MHHRNFIAALALAGFLFGLRPASAAPVAAETATRAVLGWLRQDPRPLGRPLNPKIKRTEAVKTASGDAIYYVVHLDPAGFVILSADDAVEPIVAFSAGGHFGASSPGALAALVNRDLPRRAARARAGRPKSAGQARSKWRAFLAGSDNPPPDVEENGGIVVASQIWIAPLMQTLWSQTLDLSETVACYNYFTDSSTPGNTNNDPCGCVATAMAQEMYYFQYPNTSVGRAAFTNFYNGLFQVTALLGGDGLGGPYQWTNMPLAPNVPTANQAAAIGALTHDAAAAVNMIYTPTNSSAYSSLIPGALMNVFKFPGAAYFEDDTNGLGGTNLLNMINPNLDAHLPVLLGIAPAGGGHCLVCDGYGYSSSTLFHHLNTGFAGDDDIWYALPDIDTSDNGDFTTVAACVYNIFTNGSGQILSGRITDPTGAPVAGVSVSAAVGINFYQATTDSNGIYALIVPGDSSVSVLVNKNGDGSATGNFNTGVSTTDQLPSGNVWGANFVLSPSLLAIPETGFAAVGPVGGPFNVLGQVYVLTNRLSTNRSWSLANTNNWLTASATNGGVPAGSVSTLTITLNSNAATLAAGVYSGTIWITNGAGAVPQPLTFSLSVETADYPIGVTGYNRDVVVENAAVGGSTINYADAFDPVDDNVTPNSPVCYYESGLAATNLAPGSGPAMRGLPVGGFFTNESDLATTFQLGPYDSRNVLYLTSGSPSGALALNSPAAFKSLSVLAASAQGGGTGTLALNFADGSTSSNLAFAAPNHLTSNAPGAGAAITNFGLLIVGDFPQFLSLDPFVSDPGFPYPTLYQTSIDLHDLGYDTKPISAVTFTLASGAGVTTNTVTGIFALSGTQTAYAGNYAIAVAASPVKGGSVTGAGTFAPGTISTVTATANYGYTFANWTVGGNVVSTLSDYSFIVSAGATVVANFVASNYSITLGVAPRDGGGVSGSGTFQQGTLQTVTATPNAGFEFIGWTGSATGANNPLTVTVTTNLTITANFLAVETNLTVTVLTNGEGRVLPYLIQKNLKTNRTYTLTATPASGNVFSNWTGSIVTNKNPLTFKLESNIVLEANFVPNPFLPLRGTYNGLFASTNGVTEQTAGMLKGLVVAQKGTYSGTLLINGASHAVAGAFNLAGLAANTISRPANQGGKLTLAMALSGYPPPPQVTGVVAASNWTAPLIADRATNTVPSAEFTMLLPPDTNNPPPALSPGGDGYASITNHLGNATVSGALADGTAFNQTTPVSGDGYLPIYASLYGGKGLLLGWINLESTVGAGLTWIHPARPSGLYTNGFTNVLPAGQILLSPWSNSPDTLALLTNLSFVDNIGDTNTPVPVTIVAGKVSGPSVTGTVNSKTGQFKVTLGSGPDKTNGYGAILLNATNAAGYFLTKTNAQAIELGP